MPGPSSRISKRLQIGCTGRRERPVAMGQPHQHHEVEINLLAHGEMTYAFGGQVVRLEPGRLSLFWASVPHQTIHVGEDARFYWFTIPLSWVSNWKFAQGVKSRLFNGEFLVDPQPDAGDIPSAERWIKDLGGLSERHEIALLEIEARVRRLALNQKRKPQPKDAKLPMDTATRIMAYVAQHCLEPISTADVADALHLNPSYATTCFRKRTGYTIGQFITRHRCFHAYQLLVRTDLSVTQIAYESGFNSQSRFFAAFKSVYGSPPRACRLKSTDLPET